MCFLSTCLWGGLYLLGIRNLKSLLTNRRSLLRKTFFVITSPFMSTKKRLGKKNSPLWYLSTSLQTSALVTYSAISNHRVVVGDALVGFSPSELGKKNSPPWCLYRKHQRYRFWSKIIFPCFLTSPPPPPQWIKKTPAFSGKKNGDFWSGDQHFFWFIGGEGVREISGGNAKRGSRKPGKERTQRTPGGRETGRKIATGQAQ